jgi:glucosylglycerol-phosphate synthase
VLDFPHRRRHCVVFLATDLDGTFLAGRQAERLALYRVLRAREDITLAFVTGRGVESVLPLLHDPLLPTPAYVIADVGATILATDGLRPVQPLQGAIDQRWPGVTPILKALRGLTGLTRQRVPQERRCSFFIDDLDTLPLVEARLAALDVDTLLSAGRYLDVLPAGVSKGKALEALIAHLGHDPESVLVAGDTLNDLSMYEHGFRGVVVGAAEPALVAATAGRERVFHAAAPGAGGIIEAARHFDTPLARSVPDVPALEVDTGPSQVVVVYHRLPFEERLVDGQVHRRPPSSPNGIIPTLLGSFARGRSGTWVAWSAPGAAAPALPDREYVDEAKYGGLVAARVPLTERDVQRFYKRFSKEAFWPVIFSFVDRATFSNADWAHFCTINRTFAERTAAEADDGALVWIHDYNLWMVPAYLRELRPDVRIGFFHHTSLPPADVFNVIPWAAQIASSLSQCDHLGFHIPRYAANFVDVLQSHGSVEILETEPCAPRFRVHGTALGVSQMHTRIKAGNRIITLGAHPVGVDAAAIRASLARPEAQAAMAELRARFYRTRVIISVERLDYVKGPLQKLAAFERLLDQHPALRGTVTLLFVTTPPADGMEVYARTREQVDQIVGRINGRFGTLAWTPIHYQYRSIPFDEVLHLYAVADLAWITPLRDGLNLVAKEYVVAQDAVDGAGVLVLSEFAGAAVELHGATMTNPYHIEGMTAVLAEALSFPEASRRQTIRRLTAIVEQHDVESWSRELLVALEPAAADRVVGSPAA